MRTAFPSCRMPILLSLLLFPLFGYAQIISFELPQELSVCQTAAFEVSVNNNQNETLTNGLLTLSLPDCISYEISSVSGGTEADVSDPGQPVFELADMPVGQDQTLTISLQADCACVDLINAAETFQNEIEVDFDNGNATLTTGIYPVETPLLLITDVQNSILSGSQGAVLQRSFTVENTRLGPLSSFRFSDTYQDGILLDITSGNLITDLPGFQETELTGAHFQTVGDGDPLFEFGESITITETIEILDCGIDISSSLSVVEVSWGCYSLICQDDQENAVVAIEPYELEPELVFEPFTTAPYCFCGPEGHLQGLTITNAGSGAALDIQIQLGVTSTGTGLDPESVMLDSIGNSYALEALGFDTVFFDAGCIAPELLFNDLGLEIPELGPGESIFVHWNQYFCKSNCQLPLVSWNYTYNYYLECPEGSFVPDSDVIPVSVVDDVLQHGILDIGGCSILQDEDQCTFAYFVAHDTLDTASGHLSVDLYLPCGYTWQTLQAPDLGGMEASVYNLTDQGDLFWVHLEYPLPFLVDSSGFEFEVGFDCDSLCEASGLSFQNLESSCPEYENCNPPELAEIDIPFTTSLNTCMQAPDSCAVQACGVLKKPFECDYLDTIDILSDGYYYYTINSRRWNFGLPDNDNDHFPDAGGDLMPDSILMLRFLPGDTIYSEVSGIVIADAPGASYDRLFLELEFLPQNVSELGNPAMFSPAGIPLISAEIEILDFSEGQSYSCSLPIADAISYSDEFGV